MSKKDSNNAFSTVYQSESPFGMNKRKSSIAGLLTIPQKESG
jgi:hypothetical protein